ncbi:hypothetical protein EHS13_17945 [Paenibacillus psychroresistens]|uniref:YhfM-like domain-containing protein n=1 Tax=Paenibacillus psychroresistens TaxID=1778678 RepID=A0A6B8RM54_9BACL|nr:hypothetical protein [Paenibacillus psychroresistens]QGQ96623.1 hypothetical protein EHS13_17945 [Paenibacillus psychroresistens]
MKANLRTILISLLVILVLLSSASYFIFRVTENHVVVNKMIRFYEVQPDSERVLKDEEAVKQFTYAVRFADKQRGRVDMADPPFQFTLGNKVYYLWVSERFGKGTLMKLPNTGTVYTIGKSRTKSLLDILNKEY